MKLHLILGIVLVCIIFKLDCFKSASDSVSNSASDSVSNSASDSVNKSTYVLVNKAKYQIFDKIYNNITNIKNSISKTNPNTKFGFVIKSSYIPIKHLNSSFGPNTHIQMAKYVSDIVDVFCISSIFDGIMMRKQNINKPIILLYITDPKIVPIAEKYDIEIVIPSIAYYRQIRSLIQKKQKAHIWYDLAMGKEGYSDPKYVYQLYKELSSDPKIELVGLGTKYNKFKNISTSKDIPSEVLNQHNKFKQLIKKINDPHLDIHTACSYEYDIKFTESYFDLVRIGSSVYANVEWKLPILDIQIKKETDCFGYYCEHSINKNNHQMDLNKHQMDLNNNKLIKIAYLQNTPLIDKRQLKLIKCFDPKTKLEYKLLFPDYNPLGVIIPMDSNLKIGSKLLLKTSHIW